LLKGLKGVKFAIVSAAWGNASTIFSIKVVVFFFISVCLSSFISSIFVSGFKSLTSF